MKEIGGYLELECARYAPFHNGALLFNSGRNALKHIIREYEIQEIHTPFFTCPVVWEALKQEGCKILPYDVDTSFKPLKTFEKNSYVIYNDYFGVCSNLVSELSKQYPNLIVDNAQAFYAPKQSLASFYSPRKFFGLPDGGLALCDKNNTENYETSVSYDSCAHLLGRYDLGASAFYSHFQSTDKKLSQEPIKLMSKLTQALMGNIDYTKIKEQRLENFNFLHQALKDKNEVKICLNTGDVPMVYPFLIKNETMRKKLIENKIYIASYWPQKDGCYCMSSEKSLYIYENLLPIPIDQRYELKDMQRILEVIGDC